ncbi:M18 family aminopeptidase [Leucobacter sp. USHLN153]|uniref:M18 family aminopeptidase n=1 Tax=Leucobacter sp. USHLN153 TaxID=3081268 RepID=UPI003019BC56
MPRSVLQDRDAYSAVFADFVSASPSSYHAAGAIAESLTKAGFADLDELAAWSALEAGGRGFVRRDGAIIAWRAGSDIDATSPVRVLGTHTDSPGFIVKPQPDFTTEGWAQVGVEVYGGPLLTSWLDRDLGFAGRVVTRDGAEHLVRTGPVARIPQLAIHLDRSQNSELTLDKQRHTQPIIGLADEELSLSALLIRALGGGRKGSGRGRAAARSAARASLTAEDLVGLDLRLYDTQEPQRIGANAELFASARLDNLSSTYAALAALLETEPEPGTIAMFAAFDHEEVGSNTRSGAAGPFLADVLERLRFGLDASAEDTARALAASWCLSADAGHSVHPNYAEKHDPRVHPIAGAGPMLKRNANQRYASDAQGAALWARLGETAGVPTQEFVSNNTVPCGSTIGPLTATRLGIRTVDVGVPLLSMHSARELAHVDDLYGLARVASAFFERA